MAAQRTIGGVGDIALGRFLAPARSLTPVMRSDMAATLAAKRLDTSRHHANVVPGHHRLGSTLIDMSKVSTRQRVGDSRGPARAQGPPQPARRMPGPNGHLAWHSNGAVRADRMVQRPRPRPHAAATTRLVDYAQLPVNPTTVVLPEIAVVSYGRNSHGQLGPILLLHRLAASRSLFR